MISTYLNTNKATSSLTEASTAGDKSKAAGNTTTASVSRPSAQATQAAPSVSSFKTEAGRQELNKLQTALGKDLRAALSKAGHTLTGTIDFAVSADGKVSIVGNDKDKAAVQAALKADKTSPSIESRIKTLDKKAEDFDKQYHQTATMQQAARYASKGTNMLQLYTSLMAKQTASSAVFSVSAKDSQIAFKGVVSAQA